MDNDDSFSKYIATSSEFNGVVEADELAVMQQIADANRKCLALRPAALNSTSSAPCFVKIQELQETFEKQLKAGTEASVRKLKDLCEQQKADYNELYQREKARLAKILK